MSAAPSAGPPRTVHVEHVMGTVFSLDVRDALAPGTVERVVQRLHALDELLSTYRPDSEVSRLGRGELDLADCSPDVREALALCEAARGATSGLFDACAGGRLDPSGVVKGWAVEQAAGLLREGGSRRHSVNGGGDVAVGRGPAPDRPWRVGVSDPFRPGQLLTAVRVEEAGVATSGTAERGAHVLDPRTGEPVTALVSATVVGPSLLLADVLATAALVAGPGAPDLLDAHPDHDWLVVTGDGRQRSSPGWGRRTR